MKKINSILIIVFTLMSLSCRTNSNTIDPLMERTYSLVNELDSNIGISVQYENMEDSFVLKPGEEYSYIQDEWSGTVLESKIPIFLSSRLEISIPDLNKKIILYSNDMPQATDDNLITLQWQEVNDHQLNMVVDLNFVNKFY